MTCNSANTAVKFSERSENPVDAAMKLAGVDLAWKSAKKPSAIAYGNLDLSGKPCLVLTSVTPSIYGIDAIVFDLDKKETADGVAIDAPLIIPNQKGVRVCEKELSRKYGGPRKASCYSSNRALCLECLRLSKKLEQCGYKHLCKPRWQIECYPHPALIEIFNLDERLPYKKGSVAQRREGQKRLAELLVSLKKNQTLALQIPDEKETGKFFCAEHIQSLRGESLKSNEDALDAVICLYIAGLYAMGNPGKCFGTAETGYIWVPQINGH